MEYVELFRQGDATLEARKALLMEQRDLLLARMEEIQQSLDRLNYKIQLYEDGKMTREAMGRQKEESHNP